VAVLDWIVTALRESHADEKAFHDEAIARILAEYRRLQNRIDAMYLDKLDARIDTAFFDSKSAEWRAEQDRLLRDVPTHRAANQTSIEEGVQLLQLAHRAHDLFERQEPAEKRRLLNFLLSNCARKAGVLTAEYRQPFDMLALARQAAGDAMEDGAAKTTSLENWLPNFEFIQRVIARSGRNFRTSLSALLQLRKSGQPARPPKNLYHPDDPDIDRRPPTPPGEPSESLERRITEFKRRQELEQAAARQHTETERMNPSPTQTPSNQPPAAKPPIRVVDFPGLTDAVFTPWQPPPVDLDQLPLTFPGKKREEPR
jgi:hypothetical protein